MISKRELIQDDLKNSMWLGEVLDNADSDELGRLKIKVFGKFDELEATQIPWANPMNQFTAGIDQMFFYNLESHYGLGLGRSAPANTPLVANISYNSSADRGATPGTGGVP